MTNPHPVQKVLAEACERCRLGGRCAADDGAGLAGKAKQRAGLHRLQAFDVGDPGPRGLAELVGLQIEALSAGHAGAAGRHRQPVDQRQPAGVGQACVARLGQQLEGERQQRVPGQDGGPLVEGMPDCGLAAAQRVVVHGRQVVMHQRVAMHQFEREGCRHGGFAPGADNGRGLDHQERADALAGGHHGMPHGGRQPIGDTASTRGALVQHQRQLRLDVARRLRQPFFERHRHPICGRIVSIGPHLGAIGCPLAQPGGRRYSIPAARRHQHARQHSAGP